MTLLAGVRRGAAVERHAATPRISSLIDGDCINEDVSQKNHRSKTKLFMIFFLGHTVDGINPVAVEIY